MRVIVTLLIVEAQTCVQDEVLPLVLELYKSVEVTLVSCSIILDLFHFRECVEVLIAKSIAHVLQLEITVFRSKGEITFMVLVTEIVLVSLQFDTYGVLLTIDITVDACFVLQHLLDGFIEREQ